MGIKIHKYQRFLGFIRILLYGGIVGPGVHPTIPSGGVCIWKYRWLRWMMCEFGDTKARNRFVLIHCLVSTRVKKGIYLLKPSKGKVRDQVHISYIYIFIHTHAYILSCLPLSKRLSISLLIYAFIDTHLDLLLMVQKSGEPVEVGRISNYLRRVFIHSRWLALGFLNHQQ